MIQSREVMLNPRIFPWFQDITNDIFSRLLWLESWSIEHVIPRRNIHLVAFDACSRKRKCLKPISTIKHLPTTSYEAGKRIDTHDVRAYLEILRIKHTMKRDSEFVEEDKVVIAH
ncbi:hypothetical protein IGI04_003410 [Brassica rapa subsp. trilocularis]|uniref:Uncharacterized protein n=1 Tax=Brassica rapa subsp. trilocularis TaxID=1813537 RepID=A0ABQ7NYA9_BRACM|nr:hypothetical protein IGI04_003410 [Brassica rapa subsp. trilocularis]